MKTTLCLAVATMFVLSGCSTTQKLGEGMPEVDTAMKRPNQYKQEKVEYPDWYVNIPTEKDAVYATATEVSNDMQFAMDKALFTAKRELAFKLENSISQKIREFATETNYSSNEKASKETERLVIANSKNVDLTGAQKVKSELVREGNRYRAYVLVRFGLDDSNKMAALKDGQKRRGEVRKRLDKYEQDLTASDTTVVTPIR